MNIISLIEKIEKICGKKSFTKEKFDYEYMVWADPDPHKDIEVRSRIGWRGLSFRIGHDNNSYYFEIYNLGLTNSQNIEKTIINHMKKYGKKA